MKKILFTLVTLLLPMVAWAAMTQVPVPTATTALNKGDSNGDGIVNVADIVEVANYIMGNPSNTFVKDFADINNDGVVNATDIIEIVKIIMSPDNQATTDNEIDNFGDYDDTEYFEININGETFTDDTWGGSWLANYETKTKNGVEVYPYGGLSETITISDQDGLQYAILAGYTSENLKTVFPKSKGTYDVISSRGNYFISDYSDNVGMVISGGNMNRRTVTSGSLIITNVSQYKDPYAKDYLGREEMYATEGTFSFTLKDDWDGNENMISGKFRLVF